MNPNADTLNIKPVLPNPGGVGNQLAHDHDPGAVVMPTAEAVQAHQAELEPGNHPDATTQARQRITELMKREPLLAPHELPAMPTEQLIVDKPTLAKRYAAAEPTVSRRQLPSAARPAVTAIGIFAIMLLLFKAPVIISQLTYSSHDQPTASTAPVAQAAAVVPAEPTITIPKINVTAPVVYEPSIAEGSIQKALETGVVHYGNTALPGRPGNSVIFGHSSNDWWEPGNYKFVFVLLDKLVVGDQFSVNYDSKHYTYQVTGTKVVAPTEVSVLNQTAEPTMTLITCSPPGTSFKRLVITAKQIDPSPNGQTPAAAPATQTATAAGQNLPGTAPSFFDTVASVWQGFLQGVGSLFGAGGGSSTGAPSTTPAAGQLPAVK